MKEYSVLMSIVDYIPVFMFGVCAVMMQKDFYDRMYKGGYALFAAGTIDIFMAGFLKATYKLLYALGICDLTPLSEMFFPVQSLGFLLAGLAVIAMLRNEKKVTALSVAPVVWRGTGLFVAVMIAGLACMFGGLAVLAARNKKPLSAVLMVLGFICYLCMGYLSTGDFSGAAMNWIAEGVNTLGQCCLLSGLMILRKGEQRRNKAA